MTKHKLRSIKFNIENERLSKTIQPINFYIICKTKSLSIFDGTYNFISSRFFEKCCLCIMTKTSILAFDEYCIIPLANEPVIFEVCKTANFILQNMVIDIFVVLLSNAEKIWNVGNHSVNVQNQSTGTTQDVHQVKYSLLS